MRTDMLANAQRREIKTIARIKLLSAPVSIADKNRSCRRVFYPRKHAIIGTNTGDDQEKYQGRCHPYLVSVRHFGVNIDEVTVFGRQDKKKMSKGEAWEEIEANTPSRPTLEGYERPKGAPLPTDLTREEYHKFMKGKPGRFSREYRCFMMGTALTCFLLAETAFTIYKLKPDDFSWIEEERSRAASAKARIDERLKEAQASEQGQVAV